MASDNPDSDPRLERLRRALERRPSRTIRRDPETQEAAVALVLRPRPDPELLLIKRAEIASDPWSGHMALPGGRRDPRDPDLLATALRETEEEAGIALRSVGRPWGTLDEVGPRTPRLPPIVIAPHVVLVPPRTEASPDPREVQAAFWVPLAELRGADVMGEILIELEEGERRFPSIRYGEEHVWGLTFRILELFMEAAEEAGL